VELSKNLRARMTVEDGSILGLQHRQSTVC